MEFFTQKIKMLTPTHARLVKRGVLAGKDGCIRCTFFFLGFIDAASSKKRPADVTGRRVSGKVPQSPGYPCLGPYFLISLAFKVSSALKQIALVSLILCKFYNKKQPLTERFLTHPFPCSHLGLHPVARSGPQLALMNNSCEAISFIMITAALYC